MTGLKLQVKINNNDELKQAHDLLLCIGYSTYNEESLSVWASQGKPIWLKTNCFRENKDKIDWSFSRTEFGFKEITLPELRAIVNQDQDEPFLTPETTLNDQYAEIEEVRQVLKDNVNHPSHYADSAIECIDAMEAMMTPEQFIGYLRGNLFKYQWRYEKKNGIEDLKKAQWYLEKLTIKIAEKNALF